MIKEFEETPVLSYYLDCVELCVEGRFVNAKSEAHEWHLDEADKWNKHRVNGLSPQDALAVEFGANHVLSN